MRFIETLEDRRLFSAALPAGQLRTASANATLIAADTSGAAPTITSFSPTSGPVGSTVIIDGTNFEPPISIAFGGNVEAAGNFSSTEITVTVPYGAQSGAILVSTATGSVETPASFIVGGAATTSAITAALKSSGSLTTVQDTALKLHEQLLLTAVSGTVKGPVAASILLSTDSAADGVVATLSTFARKVTLHGVRATPYPLVLPKITPASIPAGTYHVVIESTDTAGNVTTTDSGQLLTVEVPTVDLTAVFSKTPVSVKAGKIGTFLLKITNQLDADISAVGPVPIEIEASPDGLLDDATLLTPGTAKINLKPGVGHNYAVHFLIPVAGTYFLIADVDPTGIAFPDEINPADNTVVDSVMVTIK